jgi:PIN domain nuclease of toxin-antitoxin system
MLAEKQRLVLSPGVEEWIGANLRPPVELEPIHPSVAIASARLKDFHGDPADRIIVATAMLLGVPLVTADQKIIAWAQAGGSLSVIGL